MQPSSSNIKKTLIFSQKKSFLYFLEALHFPAQGQRKFKKNPTQEKFLILQEIETSKKLLIFLEMELCYILGNGTFEPEPEKMSDIS